MNGSKLPPTCSGLQLSGMTILMADFSCQPAPDRAIGASRSLRHALVTGRPVTGPRLPNAAGHQGRWSPHAPLRGLSDLTPCERSGPLRTADSRRESSPTPEPTKVVAAPPSLRRSACDHLRVGTLHTTASGEQRRVADRCLVDTQLGRPFSLRRLSGLPDSTVTNQLSFMPSSRLLNPAR
jgi:hypothetical protein